MQQWGTWSVTCWQKRNQGEKMVECAEKDWPALKWREAQRLRDKSPRGLQEADICFSLLCFPCRPLPLPSLPVWIMQIHIISRSVLVTSAPVHSFSPPSRAFPKPTQHSRWSRIKWENETVTIMMMRDTTDYFVIIPQAVERSISEIAG